MRFKKNQPILWTVIIGLGVLYFLVGTLAMTSSVLAQGVDMERAVPKTQAQALDDDWVYIFTDTYSISITDLSGTVIGEGTHEGDVRCNGSTCNQRTELAFTNANMPNLQYKFSERLAFDSDARRAVVAGTGTIFDGQKKERFSFTATFEDNRDGTVSARYVASRPDASFIVANAPGTFTFRSRR